MKRFVCLCLTLSLFLVGCAKTDEPNESSLPKIGGLAVYYLDVGEADAVLIKLPDGKVMLIDSGEATLANRDYIKDCITQLGGKIDYFLLSHPDGDHAGNASFILSEFTVSTVIVPDLVNPSRFGVFGEFYQTAKNAGVNIEYSATGKFIANDEYFIGFLSPDGKTSVDSPYYDLDLDDEPTAIKINSVSPVVYLQCYGRRFLFTGDAPAKIEKLVADRYSVGYYDKLFSKNAVQINLSNIDFLKVPHHGSQDASSVDFLKIVKPQNAIISVGVNNYGHPSTVVVNRYLEINPNAEIWRTDYDSTVSVLVSKNGMYTVKTAFQR